MTTETRGLDVWLKRLGVMELPVLANVISELNNLADDTESSAEQLSAVILKDATLTSQVLRIANSVAYNPTHVPIATISRAVVLIGFSEVRTICISAMVIDSLLGCNPRSRLLGSLAQSFHAAIQAKNIGFRMSSQVREEVFIGALLFHLGEMAFWSCGKKDADKADVLMREPNATLKVVTDEITGCSFKLLTKELAKSWGLGEVLVHALTSTSKPEPKVSAVLLGEEVSRAAKHGWESKEIKKVLKKIVAFTGTPLEQVKKMVKDSANEAASSASLYGASRLSRLIPSTKKQKSITLDDIIEEEQDVGAPLESDKDLQLKILRELSSMVMEKVDVNVVFQTVLEGLARGVGLERVMLALVNPKQGVVEAKFALGRTTDYLKENFIFKVSKENHNNVFSYSLQANAAIWMGGPVKLACGGLLTSTVKKITLHFGRRSAQLARRKSAGICRYFKVLQHSQMGCSGVQNVKLFFYRPLLPKSSLTLFSILSCRPICVCPYW